MWSGRRWSGWVRDRLSPVPGSAPTYHVVAQSEDDGEGSGTVGRSPSPSPPLGLDAVASGPPPAVLDRNSGRILAACALSFAVFMALVLFTGQTQQQQQRTR